MALDHTGLIQGEKNSALLISPQSAYVLVAQCTKRCPQAFYVAGPIWTFSVDQATILRTEEAGEAAKEDAKANVFGCLAVKGVTFDVMPLSGFVK